MKKKDNFLPITFHHLHRHFKSMTLNLVEYPQVSHKFCNVSLYGSLQHVYHITKAVQAVVSTIIYTII